ncbi:uncharacterized protein LOC143054965 [Mytilus galloprovincialis]|uniref:uncharacterized protein LOC143054965 n=1 Tax=Mytilus galloprovincialis TaxID=29158 RepID=UPI003F7B7441
MAVSPSIEKAQNMALCQFCEESTIKWKCINCGLFLCQFCCSKIHSKIKASQEHTIINLKDCGTKEATAIIQKVDLENMSCTIHTERKCWVYCDDCSNPICSDCLTESHKKHEYKKLHEVFDTMISNIHAMKDRLETEIQLYKKEKENLEQLLSDGDENFEETKIQIIEAKKEMKKIISAYASDLLEKLEVEWKPVENKIKRQLSTIIKNKNELESRKRLLDKTLRSHQTSDIFCVGQTLENTLPTKPLGSIQHKKTKFICGKVWEFESEISTTFGELYTVPSLELIDSYETDISIVTKIHCDYNNELVIASWFDEKLQTVMFDHNNICVENEVKTRIYDMARIQNEDIILSSRNHNLRQYTTNGQENPLCRSLLLKH